MALQSDTPDFLFENANRSFPFEDSNELQENLSFSSVLDLKGFSRSPIAGKIKLMGISRWNNSDPAPSVPSEIAGLLEEGNVQIFFMIPSVPSDLYLQVGVQIGNVGWPYSSIGSVQNEAGTDYIKFSAIFGASILTDFVSTGYTEFTNIFLEQSVVMECYKKSLDQLKVLRSTGEKEYITNGIIFSNGINSSVTQSGSSIRINTRLGDGLGRSTYTGTEGLDKCEGVLSIDGILPNADGQFTIQGGLGVSVVDDPTNHKIIISIQSGSRLLECSEAP